MIEYSFMAGLIILVVVVAVAYVGVEMDQLFSNPTLTGAFGG